MDESLIHYLMGQHEEEESTACQYPLERSSARISHTGWQNCFTDTIFMSHTHILERNMQNRVAILFSLSFYYQHGEYNLFKMVGKGG